MKRLAEDALIAWYKSPRRKPLIIRGARQVGKTWLVEKGLAPHFTNLVKVDLEKRRDLHFLFAASLEPKVILQGLEVSLGRIVAGKTLLFFDEIQACPRAIMALRYFYEQMPELHVVAAGSLLEFAFADISVPVSQVLPRGVAHLLDRLAKRWGKPLLVPDVVQVNPTSGLFRQPCHRIGDAVRAVAV